MIVLGMNGVGVGRNGLILWENDGMGSRKVFKWLLDLWDSIKKSKNMKMSGNSKIPHFTVFLYISYIFSIYFYRISTGVGGMGGALYY